MFYVYILRSQKTGRRYVGSCEDLDDRVRRHNAGEGPATKHGVPWILVHSERFETRLEAMRRERYYKTGRGRDELERLDLDIAGTDDTRRKGTAKMNVAWVQVPALIVSAALTLHAQDAAQPSVELKPKTGEQAVQMTPSRTPHVPELSQLDEAFNQTSLGPTADEYRVRVQLRKLQNAVANDAAVVAAKQAAETARTDLEKRERLRDYYNIYYGRMAARASSPDLKAALAKSKAAHLALLNQPRVRPTPANLP
jgi:putative endonuclease